MSAKRKPEDSDMTHDLYWAITNFLSEKGWQVLVMGGVSIEQRPDSRAMNYEFVVKFTGGRRTIEPVTLPVTERT